MEITKVTGKRLDNGEEVTGYYGKGLVDVKGGNEIYKHFIMIWNIPTDDDSRGYFTDYEVDPSAIMILVQAEIMSNQLKCDIAIENIKKYIEQSKYTYDIGDIFEGAIKRKRGYYNSFTMNNCLDNLEKELEILKLYCNFK